MHGLPSPSTARPRPGRLGERHRRSALRLRRCVEACDDLLVALGTSLVVGPVNQMFPIARAAGARTAIATASETPYDGVADVRLIAPLEEVLPAVRDLIL